MDGRTFTSLMVLLLSTTALFLVVGPIQPERAGQLDASLRERLVENQTMLPALVYRPLPMELDTTNGTNNSTVAPNNLRVFPVVGVLLLVQDKTFADAPKIAGQEPAWAWGLDDRGSPVTDDSWYPDSDMPNGTPWDSRRIEVSDRWSDDLSLWPPTDTTYSPTANSNGPLLLAYVDVLPSEFGD